MRITNAILTNKKTMRVAFTGPSGSGKTTLVKWVEEKYGLTWLNGSSGEIKTASHKAWVEAKGLVQGKGHAEVIRTGHMNPDAGIANQKAILEARSLLLANNDNYVTDRSTLDNMVYFIVQCGIYLSEKQTQEFLEEAELGLANLTHLIYVPPILRPIEDNKSRVANWYYQFAMGEIFEGILEDYKGWGLMPKVLIINGQDLDSRKAQIETFLR